MVTQSSIQISLATMKELRRQLYIAIASLKKASELGFELYGLMDLHGVKSIVVRKDPVSGHLTEISLDTNKSSGAGSDDNPLKTDLTSEINQID